MGTEKWGWVTSERAAHAGIRERPRGAAASRRRRRPGRGVLACAAAAFLATGAGAPPALGQDAGDVPVAAAENARGWFVELTSAPTAEGTSAATIRAEQAAFAAEARAAGIRYRERFTFERLWNGLSIELEAGSPDTLTRLEHVKRVFPVERLSLAPVEPVTDPELATALAMTGADVAQEDLGLSGTGVRVAVMDTGIDYDHPDLGGCFGAGCRVETGHDFVGDAFNADRSSANYDPTPVPDDDPDDCNGHGTHVAGIVGADGEATGVAPEVTFGAYRVFGCSGSTTADIMIAAMERALADGMDVLNMSIGSAFQWPQYPTAQAADRLVQKGVAVVASIGNSGANGVYSAGAPGVGDKVIGVASYDNTHLDLPIFTVTPDDRAIGYAGASAAPAPPSSGTAPMARTGTRTSTADACGALPARSLDGKVALIRRGSCTFHQKARNAQEAGAAGVVLYNNQAGRFGATVAGTPAITIPVVTISAEDGALIDGRLAAGDVTMTWTDTSARFSNATGRVISNFSSYGPSPDLTLKPDIGAPGGLIRSTYPLERGGHAVLSGTSMSAPHVAGAVALLLEARPRTPAAAVRSILQSTADPRPWWSAPHSAFIDNVHRQGAGMLDVPGAVRSTVRIEPGKLSLGESQAGPATRTVTIGNDSGSDRTFTLAHDPALSTAGTFFPRFLDERPTAAFASAGDPVTAIKVPAHGTAKVDVTVTAPLLGGPSVYGGYLVLQDASDPGETYRIPYAGFKGDYQALPVLGSGLPELARLEAGFLRRVGAGETFTMTGASGSPVVRVHLGHQVRLLRAEVLDAVTGRSWHRAFEFAYLGRNSTASAFFAFSWDGTTGNGMKRRVVPDGRYVLRLTVVKALGNEPDDVETWTSPDFVIDRP